jgi:hypothetical protein
MLQLFGQCWLELPCCHSGKSRLQRPECFFCFRCWCQSFSCRSFTGHRSYSTADRKKNVEVVIKFVSNLSSWMSKLWFWRFWVVFQVDFNFTIYFLQSQGILWGHQSRPADPRVCVGSRYGGTRRKRGSRVLARYTNDPQRTTSEAQKVTQPTTINITRCSSTIVGK